MSSPMQIAWAHVADGYAAALWTPGLDDAEDLDQLAQGYVAAREAAGIEGPDAGEPVYQGDFAPMLPDEALRVLFAEHERLVKLVFALTDMAEEAQEGVGFSFATVRKATGAQLRESDRNRDRAGASLQALINVFENVELPGDD